MDELDTATKAARVLNTALRRDKDAVRALLAFRVPCNDALAGHETIQVREDESGKSVSVLALLNGLVEAMSGKRVAAMDSPTGVTGFIPCSVQGLQPITNGEFRDHLESLGGHGM